MKEIKFTIQDNPEKSALLQLIKYEVSPENIVSIQWEWPRDNSIKIAVIFQSKTNSESLKELLENDRVPIVITKGMEGYYNRPMTCEKTCFIIFPARFGIDGEVVILNQLAGNSTALLFSKIPVYYSIVYRPIPLSRFQKVQLKVEISNKFHFMPTVKVQDLLLYEKLIDGHHILQYPLDEDALYNGLNFYIKKSEQINIKPMEAYKDIVALYKEV